MDDAAILIGRKPGSCDEDNDRAARELFRIILAEDDPVGMLLQIRNESSVARARSVAEAAAKMAVTFILSENSSQAVTPFYAKAVADFLYRVRIHLG